MRELSIQEKRNLRDNLAHCSDEYRKFYNGYLEVNNELGLSYEIDETKTIRCTYCGYYILRYEPNIKATKTFDDIFYKTRIGGVNEKGTFSFFYINRVHNDDCNYNFLKDELIKTINKFKLEKIEKRKEDLCKDF